MAKSTPFTLNDLEKKGFIKDEFGLYSKPSRDYETAVEAVKKSIKPKIVLGKPEIYESNTEALHQAMVLPTLNSTLTIAGIVAGLNGNKGLMRAHWSTIKKQKDLFRQIIKDHLRENKVRKHEGIVSIQFIGYKSALMDWDNFCSSFKHIGDSLVKEGILSEDNPKIILHFMPKQIKCKRIDQKVIVIIKDISE